MEQQAETEATWHPQNLLSLREYARQISAHRKRMRLWGSLLGARDDLALQLVFYLHDAEKWLWFPLLYYYRCGRRNRLHARKVYSALNATGRFMVWAVRSYARLAGFPISDRAMECARWYEKIADCLDRSMDPVARIELGDCLNATNHEKVACNHIGPPLSQFLDSDQLVAASILKQQWLGKYGPIRNHAKLIKLDEIFGEQHDRQQAQEP